MEYAKACILGACIQQAVGHVCGAWCWCSKNYSKYSNMTGDAIARERIGWSFVTAFTFLHVLVYVMSSTCNCAVRILAETLSPTDKRVATDR
jgi:hypothetical protein